MHGLPLVIILLFIIKTTREYSEDKTELGAAIIINISDNAEVQ